MRVLARLREALTDWLASRLPDCKAITPLISRSLDERISFRERLDMNLHKLACLACSRYLMQIKFIRRAMTARNEIAFREAGDASIGLGAEAKARLRSVVGESFDSRR